MAKALPDYRLKITIGNQGINPACEPHDTYAVRRKGAVHYYSGAETPLALSNLLGSSAAEARFALEDAVDASAARESLQSYCDANLRPGWCSVTVLP